MTTSYERLADTHPEPHATPDWDDWVAAENDAYDQALAHGDGPLAAAIAARVGKQAARMRRRWAR